MQTASDRCRYSKKNSNFKIKHFNLSLILMLLLIMIKLRVRCQYFILNFITAYYSIFLYQYLIKIILQSQQHINLTF